MIFNEQDSFKAMIFFLEKYYERTDSDVIGSLLGDLQPLDDGKPADSAAWNGWLDAVKMSISNDLSVDKNVHD